MVNQPSTRDAQRSPGLSSDVGQREAAPPWTASSDLARRTVVVMLVVLLILAGAYLCWSGIHVLLETFAGALFALLLATLAEGIRQRTTLSYGSALTVVILALVGIVVGTGWLLAGRIAIQMAELTQKLPQSLEAVRLYLAQYTWGQMLLEQVPGVASTTLAETSAFSRVTGMISGVAGFLVTAVVVLFVGIFGASEPEVYRDGLLHLFPAAARQRVREAIEAAVFNLRWWLVGQVVLMVAVGVTTTAGLWLLGIPLALVLGLIAGLLEVVPYLGPWLSAVPAALMALLVSPTHLLLTLGLYLIIHILEGYVLLPLVQRRVVLMAPALTLVMQVLLGDLLGLMGLFVAAPLTVVLVVLLKMLYVEDTLGDQAVSVPGEPGNEEKPTRA